MGNMSSSSWTPTEPFGEWCPMNVVVSPLSKCSLRREPTPQLAILDTFGSGVTAALQQANNNEEVWLEVLGPYDRNPEMYPGGPRGILTGSFSSRTQGAIFESSAILEGWNSKRVKSFWYSLMGVDRTPYISNKKLVEEAEALKECPAVKITKSSRAWLMTAGCIDQQKVNGRWDILHELFDNTVDVDSDEKQILKLFLKVATKLEARVKFSVSNCNPESFDGVFRNLKRRKWLTAITRNTSFLINSKGLEALNTGKWLRQITRGK